MQSTATGIIPDFGGTGDGPGGGSSGTIAGLNLQLMGYTGRFEANAGIGVGIPATSSGGEPTGAVTDIASELLLHLGSGPLSLLLTGRLFVQDWTRRIMLADNALLFGGLGLRYGF